MKQHTYDVAIEWTGNDGEGTRTYRSYRRDHTISGVGKPALAASSDPAFRGDPTRYNPEELLVASLSSCHMLWYLHLCAVQGITVTDYRDTPRGTMDERPDGAGAFTQVVLRPQVRVTAGDDLAKARHLHDEAHRFCFIANSVNFPVVLEPVITADA